MAIKGRHQASLAGENKTGSTPQMQRQPDRQRDHHHRGALPPNYAWPPCRLALVLLTQDVIQYRQGQVPPSIR